MSLRGRPARPIVARVAPSYPRALLAVGALLASSCAIYPLDSAEPDIGGGAPFPYETADADAGDAGDSGPDAGETAAPDDAQPSGFTVAPFDSGPEVIVATDAIAPDTLNPGGADAVTYEAAVDTEAGGD
jgi:hypothetical protein